MVLVEFSSHIPPSHWYKNDIISVLMQKWYKNGIISILMQIEIM